MNQAQNNLTRQRHEKVVATIERQLRAQHFIPLRVVTHRDSDSDHYDHFEFWCRDGKLLLTHRRFAFAGAPSPTPLFDLYIPLDSTNDMEATRVAIQRYAEPTHISASHILKFAAALDQLRAQQQQMDKELADAREGLPPSERRADQEASEDRRIHAARQLLYEALFRQHFPQS